MAREQSAEAYQPAVAYLRRSTDRQEQSIGDQRKAIERYADEHDFQILDSYVDDAVGGTTAEQRKAFLQLIEDAGADACPFRYVLVYDSRSLFEEVQQKRKDRLDNITPTNREYVDRRIEKLRDEIVELERRQAALQEHEDREKHVLAIADEALTVARDFDRLVEEGTIEEKRTLVRAFLRAIDFEPESRTGVAHFWVVPNADDHHGLARSAAEKKGTMPGRGRRSDVPPEDSKRILTVITDGKASADRPDAGFLLVGGEGGSKVKRHGTFGAMSSEIMVARAWFAAVHNVLTAWLLRRWALPCNGRQLSVWSPPS